VSTIPESYGVPGYAGALRRLVQTVQPYVELTKPRILAMLVFTEYCAMVVAYRGVPPLGLTLAAVIGLALTAGGSASINMWYERDIDAQMERTAKRPLVTGAVNPQAALWFGLSLGVLGVLWLAATVGIWPAALALAGYLYYAVVYTMWLKRRTPENIVIGGGAGAIPPLIGWAAVTGRPDWAAWLMFLVIFLWTPPHFWGLALYKQSDYTRAGIPMMPQVRGILATKRRMVVYASLLVVASAGLGTAMRQPGLYIAGVVTLGMLFWLCNWRLLRAAETDTVWARRTFLGSLLYLPACFAWMVLCAVM
jgi:protoheme IX farnesyltransferase